MKNRKYLIILPGIVVTIFLIAFLISQSVKPWIRKKIEAKFNEKNSDYIVSIDKIRTSLIPSFIEFEGIKIRSKNNNSGNIYLNAETGYIKLRGINLIKAVFKKDISIRKIIISESSLKVRISSHHDTVMPILLPLNIRIGNIYINKTNLLVENSANAAACSVIDGVLRLYNIDAEKQDTLSSDIIKRFDFKAKEVISVSADSMHSYTITGIDYSANSNTLAIDSFSVQPNYTDYDFTSRYKFQKSRIEARFSNILVRGFSAEDYFRTGHLISSKIEIGKMDMKVFKDKRKEFRHINKPAYQDMIYRYPGMLRIGLISLKKGNVIYAEHAEKANEPGIISFNEINAKIYNITNDPVYKTKNDTLKLKGSALLMGKGRMTILLKGRIFDTLNTFSLDGTLSNLEVNELNPILEKNAFIYATSGKIDSMNFSLIADNNKATGKLTMLYHGLDIAVKNKQTDDTTAFRERFISFIANIKVLDANPTNGKDVRVGIIDYERDPERFLLHYCFRSILTGITSSLVKKPKGRKS